MIALASCRGGLKARPPRVTISVNFSVPSVSLRLIPVLLFVSLFFPPPVAAQALPSLTIDEEVTAFAFAPDGRIAYAVRHTFGVKKLQMQRDDIWIATPDGKRTRIIDGKKLFEKAPPYSYAVQAVRWSPDGSRLAVEIYTSKMDQDENTKEGYATWLMDTSGKDIAISRGPGTLEEAAGSIWLADGATLAFLHEGMQPKLLFDVRTLRPSTGQIDTPFPDRTFSAVAWCVRRDGTSAAAAIERDSTLSGPMRLVWLDLQKNERRELAQLPGYAGQLSVSPSGKFVAYFRDQETFEVREVARPERVGRVRVAYGPFVWAADESRVLIKRGMFELSTRGSGRRSGSLDWLTLPPLGAPPAAASAKSLAPSAVDLPSGNLRPALSGLLFQNFAISPDGRSLGVTAPGSRPLQIFPIN